MQLSASQINNLRENWAQFLCRFPWDWFMTLTFREPPSPEGAHRAVRQYLRDLEKAAGQPVGWFFADEYGMLTGRFHIHALCTNVAHLERLYWMDEWNERAGYARILPYRPAAARYISKYMVKDLGYWEISDPTALRAYQPVLDGTLARRSRENETKRGCS